MPEPAPTTAPATPGSGRRAVATHPGAPPVHLRWHRRGATAEVELAPDGGPGTGPTDAATVKAVADAVSATVAGLTGAEVHLAAEHPGTDLDPLPEAVADRGGFTARRDLLQLRRPLPVATDHPTRATAPRVAVRAFRPGADDAAWLRANNRAFAGHPDQGAETPGTLADRTAEPWFDPADFLVVDDRDRPGELAGFCWTKRHPATDHDPPLGEIYVIGVDPARAGEGLGASLVLAGLDHLAGRGLATAVLYVDEDNRTARRLYDRLGFTVHRRRRVYRRPGGTTP